MRICDLVVMKTVSRCGGDGSFNNRSEHGSASQEGGITQVLFSRDGNYLNTGGWKLIATSNLRLFLAGLVHLYDLQTGQWASAFQAALV
ncbi:hypothetical protein L6164_032570 [Bauhinia variegata]|uniref:Uncharacterized protein n=1 Tax=Bauhinia variegata TaxID=167791 RepID=A0ACB9KP75_BAUVA|nr:hypothetical protein L6164_032570 [Bauhinia variegata]